MAHWAERAKARPDSKAKAILGWLKQHIKPTGIWSNERVIVFTETSRVGDVESVL